jgi:beta-glucosidase/6-phospho-beta-glucosidase/beta-galactosidase
MCTSSFRFSTGDASLVYVDGEGRVNPEGVAYYKNLISYLLQKGISSSWSMFNIRRIGWNPHSLMFECLLEN